jgi:hypothetical protein
VVFTRLLDQQQQRWGGYDRWPQETANTILWHPGEVVTDTFNLPVKAEAPAGVYTIDVGLYDQADPTASPLPLLLDGTPLDQHSVRIGPVKVGGSPPDVVLSAAQVAPQHPMELELGQPPVVMLRGYDLVRTESELQLSLYWESLAQTPLDWSIFAHLRNQQDETVAQKDGPAGNGRYPASLWDSGEFIADRMIIPLAGLSGSGVYNLFVGLYDLETGARLPVPANPANEVLLEQVDLSNVD